MWDTEKCVSLIQLYKKERVLWDQKNENYYKKNNLKEDSWRKIAEILGEETNDIKRKMSALLGSYRREKSREKKSRNTGSGKKSIYKSKWFAYDHFYFLSEKDDGHETTDNMLMDECSLPLLIEISDTGSQYIPATMDQQTSQTLHPPTRRPLKRKQDPMLAEAMLLLRDTAHRRDDTFASYGNYIANELKKYDRMTVANVKYAINNILYQAEMGYYASYNATKEYGQSRSVAASLPQPPPPLPTSPPPPPPPPSSPPAQGDRSDGGA